MQEPDVELSDVKKMYDDFTAVEDCTLQIDRGEFVTLLGPSGCGKTTTLNMIAGFFPPTRGHIRIRGEDVTRLPPNKRRVGMVFQNYALFPHLTVEQNVGFGLKMRGADRAEIARRARESLELVHMGQFAERYPRQLSGGQQQRIALARAIAPQPSVLLLDEPLSNLDLKLRESMRRELKTLQRELGVTAVFVTHDQDEALTMSDRVVVMNQGRIEQIGSPTEIYAQPRSHFVAAFVGQMNFFAGTVTGSGEAKAITLDGGAGRVACPASAAVGEGESVEFGIRPEVIAIAGEGEATPEGRTLNGTIEDVILAGPIIQVYVGLAGGQSVRVDVLNVKGGPTYTAGDAAALVFATDDLIVFGT